MIASTTTFAPPPKPVYAPSLPDADPGYIIYERGRANLELSSLSELPIALQTLTAD